MARAGTFDLKCKIYEDDIRYAVGRGIDNFPLAGDLPHKDKTVFSVISKDSSGTWEPSGFGKIVNDGKINDSRTISFNDDVFNKMWDSIMNPPKIIKKINNGNIGFGLGGTVMSKRVLKIDKKVEDLKDKLDELKTDLEELIVADKHVDVSWRIEGTKEEIKEVEELIEGYETLMHMNIGNVIINNDTVITLTRMYGEKAVSKLEDGDEFHFGMAFFMNLTKLDWAVFSINYDYSIQKALVDIEDGGLE